MEERIRELSTYRLERAKEMLRDSKASLDNKQYRTSLNRSYYAVFHGIRSLNCLEDYDSSKHSGCISFFNKTFVKQGKVDKNLSMIIKKTSYYREKSDYEDFFIASEKEALEQLENAKEFVQKIEEYLIAHDVLN